MLTNLTIYWVTETIGSSFRHYVHANPPEAAGKPSMPAGFAIFPKDIVPAPRAWAERRFEVARWREMPRGGHYAAWEEPELLAEELRAFFGGCGEKNPLVLQPHFCGQARSEGPSQPKSCSSLGIWHRSLPRSNGHCGEVRL